MTTYIDRINAAFDEIETAAIGTGCDADGIPDGSDDWDHPTAAAARGITQEIGMVWEFTTWSDAREIALHQPV